MSNNVTSIIRKSEEIDRDFLVRAWENSDFNDGLDINKMAYACIKQPQYEELADALYDAVGTNGEIITTAMAIINRLYNKSLSRDMERKMAMAALIPIKPAIDTILNENDYDDTLNYYELGIELPRKTADIIDGLVEDTKRTISLCKNLEKQHQEDLQHQPSL